MIWHSSSVNDVCTELKTDQNNGLFSDEADKRLEFYGQNRSTIIRKKSYLDFFISSITEISSLLLLIGSAVLFFTVISMEEGSWYLPVVTALLVIIKCAIIAFAENYSEKSLDKLKGLSVPTVTVKRDRVEKQIPANELVPGDIIILKTGNFIPADARLISTHNFHCNEYSLTGENLSIEKIADDILLDDITPVSKRTNMVFSGCTVISGVAEAVVTATGNDTELRLHTKITNTDDTASTPFIKSLSKWVKLLSAVVFGFAGMGFIIGIIGALTDRENFSGNLVKIFSEVVSLTVAVSPKVFLVGAVVSLLIGIKKSVKNNIIVNKLKSVELLGKVNVICCDKTGLLTESETSAAKLFDGREISDLNGDSELPYGAKNLLTFATVCCDGNVTHERRRNIIHGNFTDAAIVMAAEKYLHHTKEEFESTCPRVAEIPFDSNYRLMATVNMIDGKFFAIVKGAPEIIVEKCALIEKDATMNVADKFGEDGNRVIAVAYKELSEMPIHIDTDELISNMTFAGLIGFSDIIREDTYKALEICKKSGIRSVMVTGDYSTTAVAVAKKLGILTEGKIALTSEALKNMSDEELESEIDKIAVFSRVTPADKERIVKAMKNRGFTVAVTGNSVGDQMALISSDVGFAMGKTGTDVAKGTSDITIMDDSFNSLVFSLYEGRTIFENVLRSVHFFIALAVSEIFAVIFGFVFFGTSPLASAPIILLSILTALLPTFAINNEPLENAETKSFSIGKGQKNIFLTALWQGGLIGLVAILGFAVGRKMYFGNAESATAMSFITILLAQCFELINIRSVKESFFKKDILKNPYLFISILATLLILALITVTPIAIGLGMREISATGWLIAFLLSIIPVVVTEIVKLATPLIEELKKNRHE